MHFYYWFNVYIYDERLASKAQRFSLADTDAVNATHLISKHRV